MSLDPKKLTDAIQRGRLTPEEEAQLEVHLASHPAERAALEQEMRLTDLLDRLPPVQLSTNFTARTLAALQAERVSPQHRAWSWQAWIRRSWMPKFAAITAVIFAGLFSYRQHQLVTRQEMARNVADLLATGATLEALQNFEAIQRLSQVPPGVDRELVAALQ